MSFTSRDAWDRTEPATLSDTCTRHSGTEIALWSEWQLIQNRYTALRGVVFEDCGENIRLGGRVPSYYLKQVALAAACELAGKRPIINEIEVVSAMQRRTHSTSAPPRRENDPPTGGQHPARWRFVTSRPDPT